MALVQTKKRHKKRQSTRRKTTKVPFLAKRISNVCTKLSLVLIGRTPSKKKTRLDRQLAKAIAELVVKKQLEQANEDDTKLYKKRTPQNRPNMRLRNWVLAMRRNWHQEDKAKALQVFTISRARIHEVRQLFFRSNLQQINPNAVLMNCWRRTKCSLHTEPVLSTISLTNALKDAILRRHCLLATASRQITLGRNRTSALPFQRCTNAL
jgi:hypothetical protein